jgi:hypothetical protein
MEKWEHTVKSLSEVAVYSNVNNQLVSVKGIPNNYDCIGIGTDAAVFRSKVVPTYAFKVFSDDKLLKLEAERTVYERLGKSPFFPMYHGSGANFLVLSFIKGVTFYECLANGIEIPKLAINDIEKARMYALDCGLNPRDIHLKNMILTEGRAKLIDVSEYLHPGSDHRWELIKKGYHKYYEVIAGKKIPHSILEMAKRTYNQSDPAHFNTDKFIKTLSKWLQMGA